MCHWSLSLTCLEKEQVCKIGPSIVSDPLAHQVLLGVGCGWQLDGQPRQAQASHNWVAPQRMSVVLLLHINMFHPETVSFPFHTIMLCMMQQRLVSSSQAAAPQPLEADQNTDFLAPWMEDFRGRWARLEGSFLLSVHLPLKS